MQHPLPTLYRAVADVDRYQEFLPWCKASTVLERTDGQLATEVTVGYSSMQASFSSKVELIPLKRIHAVSAPNEWIEHLSFTWDFGELSGQRSCRVDLTLDFSLRNSEHTMMWELAQDKIIAEYVRCFSQRCVTLEAEQQEDRSGASADDETHVRGASRRS